MSAININVGDLAKPITKLIDVLAEGVGVLFRPWTTRRNAAAEADAAQLRAATDATISELLLPPAPQEDSRVVDAVLVEGGEGGQLAALETRTQARLDYQERKRQRNVEQIARIAHRELPEDVSDESVDADWIPRFFAAAQDITSEQMQELWGKMLAGEVAAPGSFSLRTLDLVRNLTKEEARDYAHLARCACKFYDSDLTFVIDVGQQPMEKCSVGFSHRMRARDAGLLIAQSGVGMSLKGDGKLKVGGCGILLVLEAEHDWTLKVEPLSGPADELLRLERTPPPVEYLRCLVELLRQKRVTVKAATKWSVGDRGDYDVAPQNVREVESVLKELETGAADPKAGEMNSLSHGGLRGTHTRPPRDH